MAIFPRQFYSPVPPYVSFGQSLPSSWLVPSVLPSGCLQLWLIQAGTDNPGTDFLFLQDTADMEIKAELSLAQSPWDLSQGTQLR